MSPSAPSLPSCPDDGASPAHVLEPNQRSCFGSVTLQLSWTHAAWPAGSRWSAGRPLASGPAAGLEAVDDLRNDARLRGYHLLFAVRGDLLEKLGRNDEARAEFERAAGMTKNAQERKILLKRAASQARSGSSW